MKISKYSSIFKFCSLVIVIVLIITSVGFAVSGRGIPGLETQNDAASNIFSPDNSGSGQDKTQGIINSPGATEPTLYTHFSKITGLPITEQQANAIPYGVVIDPMSFLYGVSEADISIEFPIENGSSRLLCYSTSESTMWKIGSLKPTRKFISNTSNLFGGLVVSYGVDDTVRYNSWETNRVTLDLSIYSDCYTVDNTSYIYTTEAMINTAINRMSATSTPTGYHDAPYTFSETTVNGVSTVGQITIPISSTNTTDLIYDKISKQYTYYKNGYEKTDMLTGETLAYTNVFVLFANTITYENYDGVEMVFDTVSGGKGYYLSGGTMTEFKWCVDEMNRLKFFNLKNELLTVNPGNVYLSYYKASREFDIILK